jgi:Flp pilus assembly protein TadD
MDNGVFGVTKARKLLVVGSSLVLIAAVVGGAYLYQIERQRQAEEATVLLLEGIAQFHQEQYETALETLHSISQGAIEDWRISYYTGATLIKLQDYSAAAVSLEEALTLNSKEEDIPFALGIVYYKLGNLGLSKSYFHSVLEIDPGNQEARGLMDIMSKLERQQPDSTSPSEDEEGTGIE